MKYLKYIIINTIISICSSVYATDTLNFELHFNIEDFFIKCDSNNILDIKTDLVDYFFEENDSTPALPWYSFSILLNPKEEMGEYLISISELTLVSNNAFVYKNQLPQNENTAPENAPALLSALLRTTYQRARPPTSPLHHHNDG